MCVCTFRGSITLLCEELFVSGRLGERGKRLLQSSNISGFARGNALSESTSMAFLERSLVFVYYVLLALEPPPLSVAEGK